MGGRAWGFRNDVQISQHPVLYTLNMPRATRAMRVKVACAKLSGCAVATSGSPGRRMWSGGVDLLVVSDVGAKCHCSAAGDAVQKSSFAASGAQPVACDFEF